MIARDEPKDKHTFGVTGRRPELIKGCSNTFQGIFLSALCCVRHECRGMEILCYCYRDTAESVDPEQVPQTETFLQKVRGTGMKRLQIFENGSRRIL